MRTLICLLWPLVSLASDADGLIDLARGVPGEFAADTLIRIAALERTPKAAKIDLLRQAFERASGAQQAYKLQSAPNRQGAAGFLNRAYRQDLDALSLRLRAIDALLPLDARLARELFQQLPPLALPPLGCSQTQAYDVSLLYPILGSVAPPRLVDQYMAALTSPAQVGPAARMLSRSGLGDADFRTAVAAFAGALRRVEPDDRSFTAWSSAGADVLALVETCRNRGVPPVLVIDAYRQYLVSHLAAERCADNAPSQANSTSLGTADPPASHVDSADPVRFFNDKLREAPVSAIEPEETHTAKSEGTAASAGACDDAECQSIRERYRRLVFNPVGVSYTQAERSKAEWRDQLPALLDELARWNPPGSGAALASFAARCGFYNDLAGVVVTAADRELVYRALLEFLARSTLRSEHRMEWFLPVNGLIGRLALDPANSGRLLDDLTRSPDAVIALYAQVEKLAPRAAGSIVPLL